MTSRLPSRPFASAATTTKSTTNPPNAIDNYDVDDDPFADSEDEAVKKDGKADSQSKKRKETDGLGIDEAVSVSKKPRVPRVKLDERRLLSDNGLSRLRAKAQNLRFKGKGHEFSDAARLLSFYQLWLDDLFPKAKFLDALGMVEKAGHRKILSSERIKWINEEQPRPAGLEDDDDLFGESHQPEERDPAIFPARVAPIFQNGLDKEARPPVDDDDPFAEEDIYNASPKRPTAATTAIASGGNAQANGEPDEDDLDALMAEAEAETQRTTSTSIFGNGNINQTQTRQTRHELDDEDDLDAIMAEAEAESRTTKPPDPANRQPTRKPIIDDDDDDDLDALMAEAEAADSAAKKPPSHDVAKNSAVAAHTVDEDEEAAMAEMEGLW